MLGWLFGGCPVDPAAKEWIEERLLWLRDEFGADELYADNTVLPTAEFFPDRFDGSRESVRVLYRRVCEYMGVDEDRVRLKFFRGAPGGFHLVDEGGQMVPTTPAGTYTPDVIRLNLDEIADPMSLVGTLAHELAHERLLGEDRIMSEVYDNELLTDLTVCFKGLGVFLANVPRNYASQDTRWPGTDLRKPEYMTPPMFGYALGLLAWVRGVPNPPWLSHLKYGVRGEFKQAVRFLSKGGSTPLKPIRRR